MKRVPFSVNLPVYGLEVCLIEGCVTVDECHGEPEIWCIDLDGRNAKGEWAQTKLPSDHPLYEPICHAIHAQCEDRLIEAADDIRRGRFSYAREMAAE